MASKKKWSDLFKKPKQEEKKKKVILNKKFSLWNSPIAISIRVSALRKKGYNSLEEALEKDPSILYAGRYNHYVKGTFKSPFHNPFPAKMGRQECIQAFKEYFLKRLDLLEKLWELRGKKVGCWCKPLACHVDILVEYYDKIMAKMLVELGLKERYELQIYTDQSVIQKFKQIARTYMMI